MAKVAMLVTNGYGPDWRVQKEAHTLALAGHHVTIISWDRTQQHPARQAEILPEALRAALQDWPHRIEENPQPVSIVRIQVRAGYRTGKPLLRKMPLFWLAVLRELRRLKPDVVHANDLDTVPPAYLYSRLARIPVIYDAHEYYAGMVQANVGERLAGLLDRLDSWLTPRMDAVLAASEQIETRHRSLGGKVWLVPNCQPRPNYSILDEQRIALRESWGVPDDALLVVYVGYLTPDRLLGVMLDAVPRLDNVWMVIGGDGPQRAQVQAVTCDRIRYLGWVPQDEVINVVAAGDVLYDGLNGSIENAAYMLSNRTFFALAAGRPILTTDCNEVAKLVRREGCGVVLDAGTADAAESALRRLDDQTWRAALSERARTVGATKYHWRIAADNLMEAYASIFEKKHI